ncbi:AAA family ATPase [Methanobrevibacter sp.]|uniref:AAA family ATPase n=1 Tax=Methanobrevibacter sp. TaxID=66852 RepID=UPI002E7842D5|nr:AAA family ATPase [Methanobrevibacter sp.]MEE1336257.1 AAA family ATPase [Methanobrevibacter sp.]
MPRKGLGKGLDSLIPPDFYNEDFDSNSPQSLEDMLNDDETTVEEVIDDITSDEETIVEEDSDSEEEIETDDSDSEEEIESDDSDVEESIENEEIDDSSEELSGIQSSEENVQTPPEIQVQKEHLEEVKKIVDKNPRITLWSSRSSAVLRYLRKTEPEFSISKEASILIDEAVSKKYPEIWALFDDE